MTMSHENKMLRSAANAALEPHLADHILHMKQQNRRPRTLEQRRDAIIRTAKWLGHPVATATEPELKAFQEYLTEQRVAAGVKSEIVNVGMYLRWLQNEGHRPDNPGRVFVIPRIDQMLPRPMADRDITRAMDAADQPLRAWIALAAFCGLRCMEIAGLHAEDITYGTRSQLRVFGKGGKERVVPCPDAVIRELEAAGCPPSGQLWGRLDGVPGPVKANRVSQTINMHLHALGIGHTAHTLRHRYGTKLYEATRDTFMVAQLMGHNSMQTTKGYVLLTPVGADAVDIISTLAG
jgi:site-specific recombinase XerD